MKNYRTPRTLAECQFVTGYSSADLHRASVWPHRIMYALAFAVGAAIVWGAL